MITQKADIFQSIKQIPVVEIARRYGLELRRSGSRYVARCPFHPDRRPSLVFFPDGRWKCFGCQAHGDAVDMVSRLTGLRPIEAASRICEDFGLPVDRPATPEAREAAREIKLERAFAARADETYQNLATLHRCIFQNLRTFEDYQRLSGLVHIQYILEEVLKEIASRDPVRRVEAWRYARRWFPWA